MAQMSVSSRTLFSLQDENESIKFSEMLFDCRFRRMCWFVLGTFCYGFKISPQMLLDSYSVQVRVDKFVVIQREENQ